MVFKLRISKKNLNAVPVLLLFAFVSTSFAQRNISTSDKSSTEESIRVKIIGMSDLHGNILTYDHLNRRPAVGGLPYVYSYVRQERKDTTQHVIFLNSGDYLQGSMAMYYYNFMDRREEYMPSVFLSKVGVDVSVFGNHDLEPGGSSIRRFHGFTRTTDSEILTANVVLRGSQRRYFEPYTILERDGLRIAILGLTTPIMTQCARTQIVPGLEILDMFESAKLWMNRIRTVEEPDLIIGLFHAGFMEKTDADSSYEDCLNVNDPMYIAQNVQGFDGIILGHRHLIRIDSILTDGHPVWLIEPGFSGRHVAVLDFELKKIPGERAQIISSSAKIESVTGIELDQDILDEFAEEEAIIAMAAAQPVGILLDTIHSSDAFFGSNFFVDLVHKVQLEASKAEVSFASPLSTSVTVPSGEITFSDLLRIYRFENNLMKFWMSGREIKDYLEYSYGLWTDQMHSPSDRLLRLNTNENLPFLFETPAYNFDSGAGLDYDVDVTKPVGQRIKILRMWNDRPFHEDSIYTVVANSYRFSGAGGHLELGAKISPNELSNRAIQLYNMQVRELIRREFVYQKEMSVFQYDNWKFIPNDFVTPARDREMEVLYKRKR
jgi:2',3'-cyclic-nucleotide 2'-phosphodiesterase/3'-nucleotidase